MTPIDTSSQDAAWLIAALPMYDWPEIADSTNRWWRCLRDEFHQRGIVAPEQLNRQVTAAEILSSSDLLLTQTCGYPYAKTLKDQVALVGTPDYGVPDCPLGYYRSAVVVRADDRRNTLPEFRLCRFVFNAMDSQSGYRAMRQMLAQQFKSMSFLTLLAPSGSHRESIRQVATGSADIATIDYVSWRLAKAYEPAAAALRVLCLSHVAPGLPYITHPSRDHDQLADVVEAALSRLDNATKHRLGLTGFWRSRALDYEVLAKQ